MHLYLCVGMYVHVWAGAPQKPEGIGSYGLPRDIRGCELPHMRDGCPALKKQYMFLSARTPLQAWNYTFILIQNKILIYSGSKPFVE